jgi:hypothetical protein
MKELLSRGTSAIIMAHQLPGVRTDAQLRVGANMKLKLPTGSALVLFVEIDIRETVLIMISFTLSKELVTPLTEIRSS